MILTLFSPKTLLITVSGLTDNDDGISIIDITEPDHPAYCFLLPVAIDIVLDAAGYLKPYDPLMGFRTYLPRGRTVDVGEYDTESDCENQDGECFLDGMQVDTKY